MVLDLDNSAGPGSYHPSGSRRWSAGGSSLILHAALFVALAFCIEPGTPSSPRSTDDDGRPVAVVLARNKQLDQPIEYLRRSDFTPSAATTAAGSSQPVPTDQSLPPSPTEAVRELAGRSDGGLQLPRTESEGARGQPQLPGALESRRMSGGIPLHPDLGAIVAAEQARLRANRPVGQPAELGLFGGAAATGRSFLFLIDRSKSMGSEGLGALEAAEDELVRNLQALQPYHRFQVVAYHHACVYLAAADAQRTSETAIARRSLLPATAENRAAVAGFLRGLAAFGATEHEMALQSALAQEPDVIFLLTDGGEPELTTPQIERITRLAQGRTTIHCIQFGRGEPGDERHFLRQLAEANQGHYQYVAIRRR